AERLKAQRERVTNDFMSVYVERRRFFFQSRDGIRDPTAVLEFRRGPLRRLYRLCFSLPIRKGWVRG
nr:hypothetical protein [Klebsiella pneumoniae]